jgi:hypothetical protein
MELVRKLGNLTKKLTQMKSSNNGVSNGSSSDDVPTAGGQQTSSGSSPGEQAPPDVGNPAIKGEQNCSQPAPAMVDGAASEATTVKEEQNCSQPAPAMANGAASEATTEQSAPPTDTTTPKEEPTTTQQQNGSANAETAYEKQQGDNPKGSVGSTGNPKSSGSSEALSITGGKNGATKVPSIEEGKKGDVPPSSERDSSCINALLSLGRDLRSEKAVAAAEQAKKSNAPIPILPTMESNGPPKKRQKIGEHPVNGQGGYQYPPDFWYWLPPGELPPGDWDVLCGRGGESNNFVGNKKYRKIVNERKEAYRSIPLKQRKAKTAFVRSIVQHVNNCGGRFIDLDESTGRYYVVTMEKARKKTSQALRETKELKWLEIETKERKTPTNKNTICPFCKKPGHKTKIAKACLLHHEWLDANSGREAEENEANEENQDQDPSIENIAEKEPLSDSDNGSQNADTATSKPESLEKGGAPKRVISDSSGASSLQRPAGVAEVAKPSNTAIVAGPPVAKRVAV